jgi:hypothetical protein
LKALTHLSFIVLLFSQLPSFAQELTTQGANNLEQELTQLSLDIDLYYNQMISVKSTLAINGLTEDSSKSSMGPDVALALETLQDNRLVLIDSIKSYRSQVEELSKNSDSLEYVEKVKYLFDVALVKAFLPRYDVATVSIFTRVFSSYQPQFVEELISRTEALNLFFAEFDTNEQTKDALSANFRFSELTKTYNSIAKTINTFRNANIYQVYSKNIKPTDGLHEASLYQSMIKGEEFSTAPVTANPETSKFTLSKVADDHFTLTLTCSGLFTLQ